MKIIKKDNFDNESISDTLVASDISYKIYGEIMVKALNDKFSDETSPYIFELKEDNYQLYEFKP